MKNVLVADDEKSFLLSLQDGFRQHRDHFQIITAGNGREAVELLQTASVDLLVTDLKMPEMDGFELLAWTSQHFPELPIIVMTAFGKPEIESSLDKHNTLQYLEKPLDLETLEAAILSGLESGTKSYIQGIALATFLQLMHLEKKSCTLQVTSADRTGRLYLRKGQLIDAECGDLKGETAAYHIIGWEETEIEMDNGCHRQEGPIESSLERVLLEACRIKDEASPELSSPKGMAPLQPTTLVSKTNDILKPGNVAQNQSPQPGQAQRMLVRQVLSHNAVQEFALFNNNNVLEEKNPGQFTLHDFDPAIYLHLIEPLNSELGIDHCNWISFFTAGRSHNLFFNLADCSLIVKLKQGARPQVVGQELSRIIDNVTATTQGN